MGTDLSAADAAGGELLRRPRQRVNLAFLLVGLAVVIAEDPVLYVVNIGGPAL
jgi:hypothetical protein